ncbi:MAG TPA: fasciclin domain-containing protein [Ilumatobacter sp.]
MTTRTLRLVGGLAALGVVVSACSDDGADADTTSTTTPATVAATMAPADTEVPMTTPAPATTDADIVDTAIAAGDFTTLVAAVQAAGLEDTLRGEGPFTVFAPTDDAFDALPEGTIETLLQDPAGDLTDILTYHAVAGAVPSADVVELDGQQITTVNGAAITIGVADDGSVTLTDAAGNDVAVVATDVQANNGVIHVIDAVLLPA